jgi:hypothetical protein
MHAVNLESWEEVSTKEAISVEQLDEAMKTYFSAREKYEKVKQEASALHLQMEQAQSELISLLEASGKRNWAVDGIGKVNLAEKLTVKVPKDLEAKKQLLQYFRNLGSDVYASMVSVNYMSLNSYYKQEVEENPNFRIPGLEEGEVEKQLRFTRSK